MLADAHPPLLAVDPSPLSFYRRWITARYTMVVWCHLGLILVYAMRVNLSVAAEKMQDQFGWSDSTKGFVLSSFFIGYAIGQIPGGFIATRFGGKWVFGLGVFATAILSLFLPLAACGNLLCPPSTTTSRLVAIDVLRVLMGLCESVTYPALYSLLSRWTPAEERSRMVAWTMCGAQACTWPCPQPNQTQPHPLLRVTRFDTIYTITTTTPSQVGTAITFPISGWIASLHSSGLISSK